MGRVLYIASSWGHLAAFHGPCVRALADAGWQVDLAAAGRPVPLEGAARYHVLPFEKSVLSASNLEAARMVGGIVARGGHELVSAHTSLAAFFARLAFKGATARPRIAVTVHGYLFDGASPWRRRCLYGGAERLVAPQTDLVLAMNSWDERWARANRLAASVGRVPGMGVDVGRFASAASALRAPGPRGAVRRELGVPAGSFLVVFPAEFSARKCQHVLVRALALLPGRFCLALPGEGALRSECVLLAERLGLAGRVLFPGRVDDVRPWYAAADALATPSRSEGLPFVVMEAFASGLPVVASDVKGNADLVSDGRTGLLVPWGDPAAMAAAIARLGADAALRGRLAGAARASVGAYGVEAATRASVDALLGLVAG